MKRSRGLEHRILLNVSLDWPPGFQAPVSKARVEAAIQRCIEKGWLGVAPGGRYRLTPEGKEAAGLVLREVPLPPHLADLVKP